MMPAVAISHRCTTGLLVVNGLPQLVDRLPNAVEPFLQHRLCVQKATIIEVGANLLGEELQQELGRELFDLLVQLILEVALNLLDERYPFPGCEFNLVHGDDMPY